MYWNLIRIAVWSGSDIQNYFANYIPPPDFCLISLWFAWMCVIVVAKVAIMLRNGRTHLNIQVNVNSIITISDIPYNTTLIVLISGHVNQIYSHDFAKYIVVIHFFSAAIQ